MKNVDIVIPIYNAYDFVKKCIETVVERTDLLRHTLVLVEDKSPDERILPMLKKFQADHKDKNIIIKASTKNGGFVKSVNIGMSYSKENDVILLNSDTEVTEGWVEKLQVCAYSQKRVATVTPLSNNASLASIPVPMYENQIPENITMEEYATLVQKISFESYPQIPTAHGFCMYITREAINEIGLFDEILFEKGYGEENDFSYRALNRGYHHLLCDNTFIYHKGTQSFSKEKEEFVKSHLQILIDKYPKCFQNTDEFARDYPLSYIAKNVKYEMECRYRKNILFVVHDFRDLKEKNLGGTTLHIYDLIHGLRDKFNFHVLYPEDQNNNIFSVISYFQNSEEKIVLEHISDYSNIKMYNNQYRNMIISLLPMLNIQLVHVHHLLKNYFDIYEIANNYQIPIITSIHDLYLLCPTIQMLDHENKFCLPLPNKNCTNCLNSRLQISEDITSVWKTVVKDALARSQKVIVPSNNTKEYITNAYPNINVDVIEHGVEKDVVSISQRKPRKGRFNIAFLGGISEHKGILVLKYLVEKFQDTNIDVHVFGTTNDASYNRSRKNYVYHGIYNREDIVHLLQENNIDLVCLLSVCPETYCYTLTESFLAGIPAISYNIGAPRDRIQKYEAGFVLENDITMEEIATKIKDIRDHASLQEVLKQNVKKAVEGLKTREQMVEEYCEIYNNFLEKTNITFNFNESYKIRKDYLYQSKSGIVEELNRTIERKNEVIQNYSHTIDSIVHSKRWKLVGNFQLPSFIRKLLGK